MKVPTTCFVWVILVCMFGATQAQSQLYRSDQGHVSFVSEAPLELIKAESDELRGIINPTENTFAFSVDIRSFLGFNSALQRTHFNENYLESEKYPTASFLGKIIEEIDWASPGEKEIRAKGILTIHGKAHERIIRSEMWLAEGELSIQASFTIPLRDHDITIPKIVVQKISELISVEVQMKMEKQSEVN